MKKRIKLIANPDSGQRHLEEYLPKVMYILGNNKFAVDVDIVRTRDEIVSALKEASGEVDYVYICGGDGTVNLAINEFAGTDMPLGIIPVGTTNVLAMELSIPINPFEAAYYLANFAEPKAYDVGKIGDNYFGLMVSYGFDAHTISKVDFNLKKIIGRYAYVLAGFSTLFTYKPEPVFIDFLDGTEPKKGYFVVVGNASFYGGPYSMTPLAKMDDGLLDVCIFKEKGVLKSISFAIDVLRGTHINGQDVEYHQVPKVKLSTKRVPSQVDGDVAEGEIESVEITICPKAVKILV
jgi:YegS/Rv2252/BmrU family lipid kinase